MITRRSEVRSGIQNVLKDRLNRYYILVDDVNIENFQFSEEFDKAIESKVTAEQLKLKAEIDLERVKIEANQEIERAKAEAEALRLQKQEITSDLIRLREIEAKLEAIDKWDGKLPTVTGGVMPFIDVGRNIEITPQ